MNKKKRVSVIILCVVLAVTAALSLVGCGEKDHGSITKLLIGTNPTKMEYVTGDLFDPTGMELVAEYGDGYAEKVTEGYSWDITTPLEEDDDEIIIKYKNKSILLFIDIVLRVPTELTVETPPTKTVYTVGEKFDKTGLTLKAAYEDGSSETVTGGFRVSPSGRLTRATTSVKITYNRKSVTVPITVNSATAQTLTVTQEPTKLTYKEGEHFDPSGLEMSVTYSDGSVMEVAAYDYSPKGALTSDVTKITVTYEGLTAEIPITVEEVALRIEVTTNPDKSVYDEGENFDPTGMVVTKYENGEGIALTSDDYTVIGGENLGVGSVVRVKLNGETDEEILATVPVNVMKVINATKEMILDGEGAVIGDDGNVSGNATLNGLSVNNDFLCNFVQGDRLTIKFDSTSALKATVSVRASSTWTEKYSSINVWWPMIVNDMVANNVFEVHVNGKKVNIGDDVLIFGGSTTDTAGDVTMFAQYSTIELANVDLINGENVVEFVFLAQVYKNANSGGSRDEGESAQFASIYVDTVTINAGAVLHDHEYGDEVLVREANCVSTGKEEQTCGICEAVRPIAIPKTDHAYGETIAISATCAAEGKTYQVCSACRRENVISTIPQLTEHALTIVTVAETDGTQTLVRTCACGDRVEGGVEADTVVDIKAEHLAGANTVAWAAGTYANRTSAIVRNGGSATVQESLKISTGGDYVTQLYGGSRIEVGLGATTATTGSVAFKVSSGWIHNASWGNKTARTGDMQFNKIFGVYVRHSDGTQTVVPVSDDVVLKGATGNYAIMANWHYVVLSGISMNVGDVIVFESLTPKTDDGKYMYWDGSTAAREVADGSVSQGNTQSSASADTVAIFYDK